MFSKIGQTIKDLSLTKNKSFNISGKDPGYHVHDDIFYKINNDKKVEWVINRTCDHAGGMLMYNPKVLGDCIAKCPNHGWKLDLKNLRYKNVNVKKNFLLFMSMLDLLLLL